jgi:hypothetical protein
MRKQFDSCSYNELTMCVKARIKWIKEYDRFLADELSNKYTHIRVSIVLKKLGCQNEIKRLLKMRRVLKKSAHRNWNSDLLSI